MFDLNYPTIWSKRFQNVNNFRGPARSSGVQQAPQNGQAQPNTDYLREIAEYDDLQAIERRNVRFRIGDKTPR